MKPEGASNSKPRKARRTEQLILFNVGAHRFAIAANAVHEIRSTDSLAGASAALAQTELPHVQHMIHRGKRTYFVVHGGDHFQLPAARPTLVLVLRDSRVAVLVDAIDRMATISRLYALPRAFSGDERQWYRGLALIEDRVVPVVNPSGFLSEEEVRRLDEYAAIAAEQITPVEGSIPV
jgi:chemotaxis signal transduction protein